MWHYGNMFNQGGMGWMMIMGLFWLLLVIAVIYFIVKLLAKQTNNHIEKETPLEVLQKEFAKGNMSEEDYLKRKKHLE